MCALAHGQQRIRSSLSIGEHQHGRLQRDNARDAALAVFGGGIDEVGDFSLAQNLHPIGVDVVEIPHQIGARACRTHGHFVKAPL